MSSSNKEENKPSCKFCGSQDVWKSGFVLLSEPFRKAQRYQCKTCGKHFYVDPLKPEEQMELKPNDREN